MILSNDPFGVNTIASNTVINTVIKHILDTEYILKVGDAS